MGALSAGSSRAAFLGGAGPPRKEFVKLLMAVALVTGEPSASRFVAADDAVGAYSVDARAALEDTRALLGGAAAAGVVLTCNCNDLDELLEALFAGGAAT